jgi:hypothetical protein
MDELGELVVAALRGGGGTRYRTGRFVGLLVSVFILGCVGPSLASAANAIQAENALPGTTAWELPGATPTRIQSSSTQIEGYTSQSSVQPGDVVDLHVSATAGASYRIEIYRLGWYQGLGGRLIACLPACGASEPGVQQPVAAADPNTGYLDAGWPVTDSITVGSNWTSGYYIAKLILTSGSSAHAASNVPFIVRAAPGVSSAILVQAAVNTWQAYNSWGGKSLYSFNSSSSAVPSSQTNAASQVSFNRPPLANAQDPFQYDYNIIRFLEKNGYDVSYQADSDTDQNPNSLLSHQLDIVAGHDEYWTKAMRDAWDAAQTSGVNVATLGANDGYWQARYADSTDRTLIEYRTAAIDPGTDPTQKTTQFRSLSPARPECLLEGEQYTGLNANPASPAYGVASGALSHPWFVGTGFTPTSQVQGVIGSEWDTAGQPGCATVQKLFTWTGLDTYGHPSEADATFYTAPSGARVFAAGTLNFSHGLDSFGHTTPADPALQAFTLNMLNDLSGTPPTAPVNLSAPSITGTPSQGAQLSAVSGAWSEAPTFSFQWSRCDTAGANCSALSGATSSTYTAVAADAGSTLEVAVTATNTAGSVTASSAATTAVSSAPTNIAPPTISGAAAQGRSLTASSGRWAGTPMPTFSYQWLRCQQGGASCRSIPGATSLSYTAQLGDVGSSLEILVTAKNVAGSGAKTAAATAAVTPAQTLLPNQFRPHGRAGKIGAILKHDGYVLSFRASAPGRTVISWTTVPKSGQAAGSGATDALVATGATIYTKGGKVKIAIRLTARGKQLLRHANRLNLTVKATVIPTGTTPETETASVALTT